MMRCISLMSSECRARDHTGGRTDSTCWQTRGMVGLGLESLWKELGLKLRQSFHESEDKAYGREGSFWTLWQTLSFLCKSNQRMMDFSNRNIPFFNIFFSPVYFSYFKKKKQRHLGLLILYMNVFVCANYYLQIWSACIGLMCRGKPEESCRGAWRLWALFVQLRVIERDTDSLCPQAPGHQGNAAKLAPMAGRSLSAFQTLLFWIFMRVRGENLVLDFTKC